MTSPTETLPDLTLRRFRLFAMTREEERLRRAAAFVAAGLRGGDFIPQVDREFVGLDSIVDAHEHLESNTQFGKIVVTL